MVSRRVLGAVAVVGIGAGMALTSPPRTPATNRTRMYKERAVTSPRIKVVAAPSRTVRQAGITVLASFKTIETPQPTTAMPKKIRMP